MKQVRRDRNGVPWPSDLNAAGPCSACGESMGFYDSKFFEVGTPHRVLCFDCGHQEPRLYPVWVYYTDG